jgi:hypothetical protein
MPYYKFGLPLRGACERAFIRASVVTILLICGAVPSRAQSFLDLKLGMKAEEALPTIQHSCGDFMRLPFIGGKRIVSDTVMLPFCVIPVRRSVGFDSASKLAVIGVTHQATRNDVDYKQHCMFEWLKDLYGMPVDSVIHEQSTKYRWYVGKAQITFEAKGYNDTDFFLLLYYYAREDSALN